MTAHTLPEIGTIEPNQHGYRSFSLGKFAFARDEYFAYIQWPKGHHLMPVDAFLRALQRDIAWGFFYGTVNFDAVIGTLNHYGTVDLFAGRYNAHYRKAGLDYVETFKTPLIQRVFEAMLDDWTNATFDPFASPAETGSAFGPKNGHNKEAITRHRVTARRMVGAPGDEPLRTDDNDPAGVYVGTTTGQLYASRNEGDSWRLLADHLNGIQSVEAGTVGGR